MIRQCFDGVYKKKLLDVGKTVADYLQSLIRTEALKYGSAGLQSLELHPISDGYPNIQREEDEDAVSD